MALTRRGRIVVALLVVAALALSVAGGGLLYLRSIGLVGESDPGAPVSVVIPEGASATEIGELLERKGVIPSAWGFRVAAFLEGAGAALQAGRYEVPRHLTARDALAALAEGPLVDYVEVTFPEGSWLVDFARILERDTHLSARRFLALTDSARLPARLRPEDVDTLEGLLWPATYQVVEDEDERSVALRLVREFEERFAQVDTSTARRAGLSPYEVVVVASMVEAEAKLDKERRKIASVIHNRLAAGMPLEIDATVAYAVGARGALLTEEDLAVDSPYNTRVHSGLPPTPIGAPGMASLHAAAAPSSGPWLYYVVSDCRGHHAFSTSYDDFLVDKAAYQELDC